VKETKVSPLKVSGQERSRTENGEQTAEHGEWAIRMHVCWFVERLRPVLLVTVVVIIVIVMCSADCRGCTGSRVHGDKRVVALLPAHSHIPTFYKNQTLSFCLLHKVLPLVSQCN
jgi:hypothetical protein